ncbi:MAG: M20 family peptidase [Micropepsaceae bacterium]
MRRILLGLLAAVALLAAIVIGRTMMVPAYTPVSATHKSTFDANAIAVHLAQAIKFRTISHQDGAPAEDIAASQAAFTALRTWIETTYPNVTKTLTREIVSDYSLLYTWAGTDAALKPILLMSHMDVVPVVPGTEANWPRDPYSGDIADGYVWGRGTLDNKQGVIGMLEAAEALIAKGFQPKRTIMFAFGHDEEIGGRNGNAKIAELLAQRKIELEFVDDEGGMISNGALPGVDAPVALVGIAEKGSVTLELTAKSAGGHSSAPPAVAETAIGRLAHAIEKLNKNPPFDSGFDETTRATVTGMMPATAFTRRMAVANLWLFEPVVESTMGASPAGAAQLHTTIAPTIITGGVKDNVMPPEAKARINFRIHPRDTVDGVAEKVKRAIADDMIEVKVMDGGRNPSPISDITGPQYDHIKKTLLTVRPDALIVPTLVIAGTDSRYYFPLTKNVFRIIPGELKEGDLPRIHGTNERISVTSMQTIADFYYVLMSTMDGQTAPP